MIIAGLDLESTGLDTQKDRIFEIAIVPYHFETKRCLGKWVHRVNPMMPINPKAQAVHGISLADLSGAPLWEDIAQKAASILSKAHMVVAHNGNSFDIPMLAAEFARTKIKIPSFEVFDTMGATWATEDGKSPKLQEMCFALDIDYDPAAAHAAEYDVMRMMECVFKALDKGLFPEITAFFAGKKAA